MKVAFDSRMGAGVLAFLGASYMIGALAVGHSARSEPPPDLAAGAAEAGLDVWKTAAALVEGQGRALVVDVRPAEQFARYHLPGAVNAPGADADEVREKAGERAPILVVAEKNEEAQRLVGALQQAGAAPRVHFLVDGARAWYLAFDLPVPLFNEAAPPSGYEKALALFKAYLADPQVVGKQRAIESLQTLAKGGYGPALLQQAGKAKPAAGKRKKISGGCG